MPTPEYLSGFINYLKEFNILGSDIIDKLHKKARGYAGGKSSSKRYEPNELEKLALVEMTPGNLSKVSDTEIIKAWHRLDQWYSSAKKTGRAIENYINAAVFVFEEMRDRDIAVDTQGELYAEAIKLQEFLTKKVGIKENFNKLDSEVILIPDFISIVGSAARGTKEPNDIDVLIRAKNKDGDLLIQNDNVYLQLRNLLSPEKNKSLHYIDNPQGPHGNYKPLYDLVLRKKKLFKKNIIKADAVKVDLGCGKNKKAGYIGIDIDKQCKPDIVYDLSKGIPLENASVDEINAAHFIEHLEDKEKLMKEIHRVLKPGGKFLFEVPSTKGEGAWNHPGHKSYWNKTSFSFWIDDHLLEDRPKFNKIALEEEEHGDSIYVIGALEKPYKWLREEAKDLKPFDKYKLPKPEMAGYTEAFKVDTLKNWLDRVDSRVAGSPKLNGFRAVIHSSGDKKEMWFEGQLGTNQLDKFSGLKEKINSIKDDFVLDVDIAIERDGARLSRPELMRLTQDKPDIKSNEEIVITGLFLPYWKKDLHADKYSDQFVKLAEFGKKYKLDTVPVRYGKTLSEIEKIGKWCYGFEASEGAVFVADKENFYDLDGSASLMVKIKKVAEIKVIVLDKQAKGNAYNYSGGLLPSGDFENIKEVAGNDYINLGKSFNTNIKASVGDIITVQILELIPDYDKGKLSWLGATVIDIDSSRKKPYSVGQAIDVANRAKGEEGGETRGERAEKLWEENWGGDSGRAWAEKIIDSLQSDDKVIKEMQTEFHKHDRNKILKIEKDKQILYSVVLPVGSPMSDSAHGGIDYITAEEAETACHRYAEFSRQVKDRHRKKLKAVPVENWIEKVGFTMNGERVNKGDWCVALKIYDSNAWKKIKNGEYNAVSIGGYATRSGEK